ncbi:hypothetical protein EDD80_1205 [Anseongella ginsenosidimutans]|uniref:VOC domain-containing protein n=1 Tax=Anseongella ginsenosidimutans TaxID=496056 RepID=A0A4R3KL27_9SPHI|nr:VOC family protein [Anseongella ginsenosidimutans]QEC53569.1 VOC family protein [Anseongella ginsenosidimutans]TCS84639.1 hypothetical protein EDD80_1205 [Anseongella ginsenosidimutans]
MEQKKNSIGSIISVDITVDNPEDLKTFYQEVIGWEAEGLQMKDESGAYEDYVMKDPQGNWIGGICHNRGVNKGIPPQWIVYINVADIGQSIEKCQKLGGEVIKTSKNRDGSLQYAMIKDPRGAVLAITKETDE